MRVKFAFLQDQVAEEFEDEEMFLPGLSDNARALLPLGLLSLGLLDDPQGAEIDEYSTEEVIAQLERLPAELVDAPRWQRHRRLAALLCLRYYANDVLAKHFLAVVLGVAFVCVTKKEAEFWWREFVGSGLGRRVGGCRGCGDAGGSAVACIKCSPPHMMWRPPPAPGPGPGDDSDDASSGDSDGDEFVDAAAVGLGMGSW